MLFGIIMRLPTNVMKLAQAGAIFAFLGMMAWEGKGVTVTNTFDDLGLCPGDPITDSTMGEWWSKSTAAIFYTTNTFARSRPGCIRFAGKLPTYHLLQSPAYRPLDFLGSGCSNGALTVEAHLKVNGTNSHDDAGLMVAAKEGSHRGSILVCISGDDASGSGAFMDDLIIQSNRSEVERTRP